MRFSENTESGKHYVGRSVKCRHYHVVKRFLEDYSPRGGTHSDRPGRLRHKPDLPAPATAGTRGFRPEDAEDYVH